VCFGGWYATITISSSAFTKNIFAKAVVKAQYNTVALISQDNDYYGDGKTD
jgi:hypothetical protein